MSGSQKTTTSGSSAPWAPAQPYLQDAMKAAKVEFDKGPQVYGGSTVVPFANQTVQGMNQMQGVANNAMGAMQNPLQAYTGMMQTLQPIAQGDFSHIRCSDAEEGLFPVPGDIDRHACTVSAGGLRHGAVFGVTVDGGRAGIDPDRWRPLTGHDGFAEGPGAVDAGIVDFLPVGSRVAAVDRLARQVDQHIRTLQGIGPGTDRLSVPVEPVFVRSISSSAENDNPIALPAKMGTERLTKESGATGKNDRSHLDLFSQKRL